MPYDESDRCADLVGLQVSQARTYEGRALPRPGEELVDQGLAFDVGTLLTRRRLLQVLGIGATGLGLTARTGGSTAGTSASREAMAEKPPARSTGWSTAASRRRAGTP